MHNLYIKRYVDAFAPSFYEPASDENIIKALDPSLLSLLQVLTDVYKTARTESDLGSPLLIEALQRWEQSGFSIVKYRW